MYSLILSLPYNPYYTLLDALKLEPNNVFPKLYKKLKLMKKRYREIVI